MKPESKNSGVLSYLFRLCYGKESEIYLNLFNTGIVVDVKETVDNLDNIIRDYKKIKGRKKKRKR